MLVTARRGTETNEAAQALLVSLLNQLIRTHAHHYALSCRLSAKDKKRTKTTVSLVAKTTTSVRFLPRLLSLPLARLPMTAKARSHQRRRKIFWPARIFTTMSRIDGSCALTVAPSSALGRPPRTSAKRIRGASRASTLPFNRLGYSPSLSANPRSSPHLRVTSLRAPHSTAADAPVLSSLVQALRLICGPSTSTKAMSGLANPSSYRHRLGSWHPSQQLPRSARCQPGWTVSTRITSMPPCSRVPVHPSRARCGFPGWESPP